MNLSDYMAVPLKSASLVIGQEQDSLGGTFHARQAISGRYTQFGLWDRLLSDDEIRHKRTGEIAIAKMKL